MYYVDIYAAQHYTDRNLVGLKEKNSEFSRNLTLEVDFNCCCLSEVPQEYYCLYSHLNFVSVKLTS